MLQKDTFLNSEGDSWYTRNHKNELAHSPDVAVCKRYTKRFNNEEEVLEIGCSSGEKLNIFKGELRGYGLDPSHKAIETGKSKHPDLSLTTGTADDLPYENEKFKLVVFGFCLYLIDRSLIFKVISEADRVLKEKGFIVITDFSPKIPMKNKYLHKEGIYSYKQSYQKLFLAHPAYTLVEQTSFCHNEIFFNEDADERISTIVLYKDTKGAYFEAIK